MSDLNVVVRKTSHPTTGAGRYEVKWRDRAGHKHTRHVPYRHELSVAANHRAAILTALRVTDATVTPTDDKLYLDEWTGRIAIVPFESDLFTVKDEQA